MHSMEKAIKAVLGKPEKEKTPCPDELALGALAEGALEGAERETVLAHVAGCFKCRELLRISSGVGEEISVHPPEKNLGRAKATFTRSWLGRIEAMTRSLLGVGDPGAAALTPAFALRSLARPRASDACEYVKNLGGDCEAELAVEQVYEGKCQLLIRVYNKATGKTARGVRISLTDGATELESLVAEKGRAVFEPVAAGEYHVVFSRQGTCMGVTRVSMKGDQK